ncbi:hypothetical protein HPB49_008059 [Dermacentor silvarum]|uniref:Uncharacterized protein n=1 Tax=Dermacentor silvarum TaxID=543639 RepID=A0ACB8DXC5_DERSI|nr:hypothetical protein HPB49_008059 [Dermacentor silvarum]
MLKQDAALLVQGRVRGMNRKFMEDLKEAGRQAPQCFWRYIHKSSQQISQVTLRGSPDREEVMGEECIPLQEEWLRSLQRQDAPDTLSEDMAGSSDYHSEYEAKQPGIREFCTRGPFGRYEVVRALWKMLAVPGLTYANAVLCLSSGVEEFLERRQRETGRLALGMHRVTSVEAIQGKMRGGGKGDIRKSATEASRGECRTTGDGSHHIRRQFNEMDEKNGCTASEFWAIEDLSRAGGAEAERPNGQGNTAPAAEAKSSLELYRSEKLEICTECCYDNSKGSALLAARFTEGVSTTCALCGKSDETLRHVVLECGGIFPPTRTQALPTALGFKTEEVGAAEVTKKRLEFWWQHGALCR